MYCIGVEWILPQRVWAGPGVQLLQGLLCGWRDVFGGRNSWDQPKQSAPPTAIPQYTGLINWISLMCITTYYVALCIVVIIFSVIGQ